LSILRGMRGGKDYDSAWGKRMRGSGPYAWLLGRRFELAAKRFGLNEKKARLRTDLFARPPQAGEQLSLFG
jgi:DNA repair photolyase